MPFWWLKALENLLVACQAADVQLLCRAASELRAWEMAGQCLRFSGHLHRFIFRRDFVFCRACHPSRPPSEGLGSAQHQGELQQEVFSLRGAFPGASQSSTQAGQELPGAAGGQSEALPKGTHLKNAGIGLLGSWGGAAEPGQAPGQRPAACICWAPVDRTSAGAGVPGGLGRGCAISTCCLCWETPEKFPVPVPCPLLPCAVTSGNQTQGPRSISGERALQLSLFCTGSQRFSKVY